MKGTIVVDFDGTLSNCEERVRKFFPPSGPQDWDGFYKNVKMDKPNEWCVVLMGIFHAWGYDVIIVSARRQDTENDSIKWLEENKVKYTSLKLLRGYHDYTPDTVLKKTWLDSYGKDDILFVLDDRQKVVDMWRANGLVCLQAYAWAERKKEKSDSSGLGGGDFKTFKALHTEIGHE